MYPSVYFQKTWQYDSDGNGFQDKIGRLLSGGQDLKSSMRASALASVGHMAEFEKQHAERSRSATPPSVNPAFYQQGTGSGRGSSAASSDDKGGHFVWVDGKGQYIESQAPLRLAQLPELPLANSMQRAQTAPSNLTRSQALYHTMSPMERTCYSWRRVNPGCMECTTKLPATSMKDHYKFNAAKAEPVDRRNLFKKTEFSEYTETKARVMHHIA